MYPHKTPITETDILKDCNCWKNKNDNIVKEITFDYITNNINNINLKFKNICHLKNTILNAFVTKYSIESVFEIGCGDGNRSLNSNYNKYIGYDENKFAIDIANLLDYDENRQFIHLTENTNIEKMELGIALDTIDQLNEQKYNELLFKNSLKYVFILNYNDFTINIPNDFVEMYFLRVYFESVIVYIKIYKKENL